MLSEKAERILRDKYYLAGGRGNNTAEDFDSLCIRVANHIAGAESGPEDKRYWLSKYYQLMRELWFLPGGRILANAGKPDNGNLFNCFSLDIEDSRKGIYSTLGLAADIFAHGGGVGYNFSKVREHGAPVSNGSHASGPTSFLKLFDYSAGVISQASRRGAQLACLNCDHPDILRFIDIKNEEGDLARFNISVGITDCFMQSIANVEPFALYSRYYDAHKLIAADNIYHKLATAAWNTGDPGILFLDRLERDNAVPFLGKLEKVNPCSEAPLLSMEACCLGSINLVKMIDYLPNGKLVFDEQKLVYTVSVAVRFLDSVHTVNVPITTELGEAARRTRKIGLGVMGWADTLATLEIPYDSDEALVLADNIGRSMKYAAYTTSELLAEEKGAYPAFDPTKSRNIWFPDKPVTPTRNAMLLGFAPTGSIALVAGVNSSIEPFFALDYTKKVTAGEGTDVKYEIVESNRFKDTKVPPKTAHEISYVDHVKMQAVWQKNVDGAISKTVNLPEDATVDDIKDAIWLGWELGVKGMTLFRDGCREFQIMCPTGGCDGQG